MKLPVETLLEEKGVLYTLHQLDGAAISVSDVIKLSRGTLDRNEVCKTIILRGRKSGMFFGILLRGNDKLDTKKLKVLFKEEVAIATKEEVVVVAGVEPGAVCPFLLNCPLYVEKRVLELTNMNCGSGSHLHGLACEVKDISKVTTYTIIECAKM